METATTTATTAVTPTTKASTPAQGVPASDNEAVLARLGRVDALNLATGLQLLPGRTGKYLDLLGRFVGSHAGDTALLVSSLADGDAATAVRLAHTLKGTAAMLGVDAMATAAARLEARLRDHPETEAGELQADVTVIDAAFSALGEAMREPAAPDPGPPLEASALAPQALRALLDELDSLLALSDTAAIELLEQQTPALRTALGPGFEALERQIQQFDLDTALDTLRALRG